MFGYAGVVRTRSTGPALMLALLLLVPTACSDGDSSSGPAPEPSAPASTETSEPAEPSGATEPTSDAGAVPFPDVAPAAGLRLQEQSVEVHAPAGWTRVPDVLDTASSAGSALADLVALSDMEVLGGPTAPELSHDELADVVLDGLDAQSGGEGRYERMPDLEVAGVSFVHITGTESMGTHFEQITVEHEARTVSLVFRIKRDTYRADPTLTQAVINSLTWR